MKKRKPHIAVISDVHLGTFGCRARELHRYLKSIKPDILVLNGDIIDIWQFRKSYFPKYHLKVLRQIIDLAARGTQVHYITGNHDESLRRFCDSSLGNIHLANKLILDLPEGKAWFFHGDIFDTSIHKAKLLARLGGWGYDLLIMINSISNWLLMKMGRPRYSFAGRIKNNVKKAVKFIGDFEESAAELAIENEFRYVLCGHIHQPQLRHFKNDKGECVYLNSGDWVENLSALEYDQGQWKIFRYQEEVAEPEDEEEEISLDLPFLIRNISGI